MKMLLNYFKCKKIVESELWKNSLMVILPDRSLMSFCMKNIIENRNQKLSTNKQRLIPSNHQGFRFDPTIESIIKSGRESILYDRSHNFATLANIRADRLIDISKLEAEAKQLLRADNLVIKSFISLHKGDYSESQLILRQVFDMKKIIIGGSADIPDIRRIIYEEGLQLMMRGKWEDAKHLFESCRIKNIGPGDNWRISQLNLGFIHALQGNHEESIKIYRHIIESTASTSRYGHPDILDQVGKNNLQTLECLIMNTTILPPLPGTGKGLG